MIYGNMREAMTLKYRKDDIFISLTEGETSHVGGGGLENMFTRERMFLGKFSFSIESLNDKIASLR